MAGSIETADRELESRGVRAAARYLELYGADVFETGWQCPAGTADFVFLDDGEIVFAMANVREGADKGFGSISDVDEMRGALEKVAAYYLMDHDLYDISVRFDVIDFLVVASDRALVKHRKNVLNAA